MGDFNEVCDESERMGSLFNPGTVRCFTQFIQQTGLTDIPLVVLGIRGVINGVLNLVSWIGI